MSQIKFILILFLLLKTSWLVPAQEEQEKQDEDTVLPQLDCLNPESDSVESFQVASSCVYNISINMAAETNNDTKKSSEDLGMVAANLLHRASKGAENATDSQPFKPKSERATTDFDDDDQVERNHFMDIHFPDEGIDANDLLNEFSDSSTIVKNYAKVSTQVYRAMEHILDAVGEFDNSMNLTETKYDLPGTTLLSECFTPSNISSKSLFVLDAHQEANDPRIVIHVHISSEAEAVLDSMGIEKLQIQMSETLDNPFFDDSSAVIRTPCVSVIMKDYTKGREHLPIILDGVTKPFEFWMPLAQVDDTNDPGSQRIQPAKALKDLDDDDIKPFHLILPHSAVVFVEIVDRKVNAEYHIVHLKDYWPRKGDFCGNHSILTSGSTENYTRFTTEKSSVTGTLPDGIEDNLDYYVAVYMKTTTTSPNDTVEYTVKFTRLSCLFRDEQMEFWSEKGCMVGDDSNTILLHCICSHASIFAGSQFAVPNDLPSTNVFDFEPQDFHDNPIILSTVCILLGLYIIGMIVCFLLDRRDRKRTAGITIMTDLGGEMEHFYYLITILTGNRFGAGTTACVCIQLYGTHGRSQVYVLKEISTPVFQRGGIDSFLVSSAKYLGKIEKIRIWHDNYGKSPQWYCRKVIIKDVKTNIEHIYFIENWLHVTGRHATIIYEQSLSTDKEFSSFKRRFQKHFVDQLDKSHLWLSIIRHPTASRFTRCQRLSCAFAILSAYLLANIVMYGIEVEDPNDPYGIQSYIVAFQMSLIEIPFGIFIIYMFWLIRQHYIPTLIIWRQHPQVVQSRPRGSIFIPSHSTIFDENERNARGSGDNPDIYNSPNGDDSDGPSENISIHSTNVEEFEDWVAAYHGDNPSHSHYIHSMMDQNGLAEHEENRVGWGRVGLIHAIRDKEPASFIYSGENDVPDVENMMDQEIKDHVLRAQRKSLGFGPEQEQGGQYQRGSKPLENFEHEIFDKRHYPTITNNYNYANIHIAFETCEMEPQKKAFCYLPWWFIFIAWTICMLSIGIFLYFTLLYGLHYGYLRSLDWLLRVSVSFLLSVFIITPVNIVVCSLLFTICTPARYWSIVDEERFQVLTKEGQDDLGYRNPIMLKVFEAEKKHPPLTEATIFELKIVARRWERVKTAVIKLIFFILLMIPLVIFAYAGRSSHDFMLVQNMRNMLKTNGQLAKINTEEELFKYLKFVVVPMLHPTMQYNGKRINVSRYGATEIDDRINILLGIPRIRQVRAPKEPCHVPDSVKNVFKECYFSYSISNQETGTYYLFWSHVKDLRLRKISPSNDVWKFRGGPKDNNTFIRSQNIIGHKGIYDGGGYVAELGRVSRQTRSIFKYLHRTNWIDQQTRAVFVEFAVYNPNLNRFLDVVILVERGPSHSFETSFYITPVFLTTDDDLEGFTWVKVSFFFLTIAAMMLTLNLLWTTCFSQELRLHKKYWVWLDIVMIIAIVVSLSVSVKKIYVMESITEVIQRMKVNEYVSLQEVAFWDGIENAAFSITQCICFLKIWRLLVFLEGGFLITSLTVGLASHTLFAYFFIIIVVLVGFACSGHIFFGSSMLQFKTLWSSVITLVGQSLQVNIFNELYTNHRYIGPIYGCLFGFIVTCLFLNILIAILNQSMIDAKYIAKEKFRNWGLADSFVHHFLRRSTGQNQGKIYQAGGRVICNDFELQPDRLEGLKNATVQFLRASLRSEECQKMKRIKFYTKYLFHGTGYYPMRRRSLAYHHEIENKAKMDEMRVLAAEFLKSKIGTDMTVNELKIYSDVNKTIVSWRIFKLEKLISELQRKVKWY